MKRVELRSWKGACCVLATLSAGLAGCVDAQDDEVPTWESYLEAATIEFEGRPIYVVEGDIAVTLDELRSSYDALVAEHENDRLGLGTATSDSTVGLRVDYTYSTGLGGGRGGGWIGRTVKDIWSPKQALDLRYCVSDDFGEFKPRAVAEMDEATRDWEQHANIDFRYVPTEDGACRNGNSNVVFAVRPWDAGKACSFFPSGYGCDGRHLMMDFATYDTPPKSLGAFRHELGHILGLQHEHIRAPDPACRKNEGGGFLALTEYDTSSIMLYGCKSSTTEENLVISPLDAAGIQKLYGPPLPPPQPPVVRTGTRVSPPPLIRLPGGARPNEVGDRVIELWRRGRLPF